MKDLFKKKKEIEKEDNTHLFDFAESADTEVNEEVTDSTSSSKKVAKKKWKDKTNKEKVFTVFQIIKKAFGIIVRFFAKLFLVLFVLLFVGGCLAAGYVFSQVWPHVEQYKEVAYEKFDEIGPNTFTYLADTVIYDKDGNIISEINIGNYEYVDIENVSKYVHEGYIAVEDKRFKVHNGIDYKGLARAVMVMIKNGGEATQGGSTITQQILKNGLLTQERTLKRKLIEFFLAPEFEKRYTKQEIMEFYVNTCFYGNNCYGIETASQYYFGKPASELNIAESAMFVGMSNNASVYNPRKNMEAVKKRQKIALQEMLEENIITQKEYDEALNAPLDFVYDREVRAKENYQTSYAIHCAVLALMEQQNFEFKYTFANEEEYTEYINKYNEVYNEIGTTVRAGGYTIYTSLDTEMQNKLQGFLDNALKNYTEKAEDGRYAFQGASVIVNSDTGFVEAIVGGRGTDDEFNRGFLAKRQPGSSIKPIVVYTPAFNSGLYYPSSVLNDKDDPNDKYYPKNYGGGYRGLMPIREALGRSINTIAYQIMKDIGPNTGLNYLAKMKFNSLSYLDNNNTAISLGGFTYGVKVVDMAKAYQTLVNQGNYIDNTCIYKIEFQNEGVIFEEDSALISVYEPDAAYLAVDCCRGVLEAPYGTAGSRRIKNHDAMAKTGTTNDAKDVWFCGATEYYSMAVWVGYDTPRPTNLTGGSIPGLIWNQMMTELHKDLERKDFEKPESVVTLNVDGNGDISKYNTGKTDLFSQTLIDKAEDERLALIESKKVSIDNERINNIKTKLNDLKVYVIEDANGLTYLRNSFNTLSREINEVYQEDKKAELFEVYNAIVQYFNSDIARIERLNERKENKAKLIQDAEKEKNIVIELNRFNSYVIHDISDIDYIEELYLTLQTSISELTDYAKVMKYSDLLNEIKGYKDILLTPYIEEKEAQLEAEKLEIIESLDLSLGFLRELTEYYEGIESIFNNFEIQLEYAEEKEVDTTMHRAEMEIIREYIYSMKPEEPEIDNTSIIDEDSEGEDIGSSEGSSEETEETEEIEKTENTETSEETENNSENENTETENNA